jgi:hypothetical protein
VKQADQVMIAVVAVAAVGAWLFLRPRTARASTEPGQWVTLPGGDTAASQQLPGPSPVPSVEQPGWFERAGTWWTELLVDEPAEVAYRTPAQWRTLLTPEFRKWENHYGLPTGFLEAIAERESAFRHDIITCVKLGGVGEKGLMQIWPKYHPDKGCSPLWSIEYAAGWFRDTYSRYQNWDLVIMAWNWGSGNMDKYGTDKAPPLTRDYIAQIGRQVDLA